MKCSICGRDCWAGSSSGTCPECLQAIIANSVPADDEQAEPEVCIECGGTVDPEIMMCEDCCYRDFPEDRPHEDDE